MKHIPIWPKLLLNILFYIFYVLIISLFFSFAFPQILRILDKPIPEPSDPLFSKTQIIIIVGVFIMTVILRKYLYLWTAHNGERRKIGWKKKRKSIVYESIAPKFQEIPKEKQSDTLKQMKDPIKKNPVSENKNEKSNEKMKIYMNKEIK